MKKHFSLFLTFFITGSAFLFAQIQDSGNHGLMTLTLKKKDLSEIKGTPYLEENFQSGILLAEGKEPLAAYMRYDVLNENIEIKTDLSSNEIFVLPSGKNAKYKLDNHTFLRDKINVDGKQITGYFLEHFKGDHFRLLEKHRLEMTEPVSARTGYDKDRPAEMKIESEFYIEHKDGQTENVRLRHKDIKNTFISKEAKEYLSRNRIKSKDDLINFVKHLDQK